MVYYTAAIVNHVALDLVRDPPIYLCQWKKTQILSQVETATTTNDSDDNGNNDDDGDDDDNYVSISARSLLYQWSLEQLSFDIAVVPR